MLLEVFMDHRVPYLFIVPLALGLLPAVGLTGIYRRYRMQLLRNKEKKRGWCAKLQGRFEEYYRKRGGLVDVKLFVRGQMEEKRFAVLRLRTWEQLSGQAPALCVGLGVAAALYASAQHFPTDYCLEVIGYGVVAAIVCRCLQQLCDVSNSRERVELAYRELLENALRPKLERAYRSAKASEKACRSSVTEGATEETKGVVPANGTAVEEAGGAIDVTAIVSEEDSAIVTAKAQEFEKEVAVKSAEPAVAKSKQKGEKAVHRAEYATLAEGMVNKKTAEELNRRTQADELNRRVQAEEDRLAELRELRLEEIRMRQERRRKEREEREERERRAMEAKAEKERQEQRARLSEKRRKEEKRAREKQAALQSVYEEKQRRLREKYLAKLQDEYAVSRDRAEQETEIIEDVLKEYLT